MITRHIINREQACVKLDLHRGIPYHDEGASEFQHGLMLWRQDTDQLIYGFFNSGSWVTVPDDWDGVSATPSRGSPPAGLFEPIRGTGHVWGSTDHFFQELGWASDKQKGFCALVQHFERGFILRSSTVEFCHPDKLYNFAREGGFGLVYLKAQNAGFWQR